MRKTILHVSDFKITRLNKAEFLGFLSSVMDLLLAIKDAAGSGGESDLPEVQSATDGIEELYIDQDLLDELQACIDLLTDMTRESRASVQTEDLAQLDKDRDALLDYIFAALEKAAKLPLATQREAGRILYNALKVYANIMRLPQKQETVEVRGMLLDMEKETLAPHVETMGLSPYAAELKRINDLYAEKTKTRSDETAPSEVKTDDIRKQAGALYQEIAERAFAANLLHETETTSQFIKDLNRLIETTIADYNRRRTKGEGKPSTDEKPQPEPDEDETPDEGTTTNPDDSQNPDEGTQPNPDDTPDTGEDDTQNPDDSQTGGGEEEPDDRPVVQ